jgi:ribosome-associated protein YbcJ (S4-like RNA binding protein)
MNSNTTTQFLTENLLTLQDFLKVFDMVATGCAADIQTIF